MSTSYANTGGTGNRSAFISVLATNGPGGNLVAAGPTVTLINGLFQDNFFYANNGVFGATLRFQFGNLIYGAQTAVIDEAKWYQDTTNTQGTWQWQGSNDAIAWVNIGAPFVLGGGSPSQTITALHGNVTAYQYYQMLGVSGITSSSPFLQQIEFRIDGIVPPGPETLTVSPGAGASVTSTYFVAELAQTDVQLPTADLPPFLLSTLGPMTTEAVIGQFGSGALANWNLTGGCASATRGAWDAATVYAAGDTVSVSGSTYANIYGSLNSGNLNHDPTVLDGNWQLVCRPPVIANVLYPRTRFAYLLDPSSVTAGPHGSFASAVWNLEFGHSVAWSVPSPGDIVQLYDVYVLVNIDVVETCQFTLRPQSFSQRHSDQGTIVGSGVTAQFQCWGTSGLSYPGPSQASFNWQLLPSAIDTSAVPGTFYSNTVVASGGTGPYTYALANGVTLPAGLSLNASTGVISGTLTSAGSYVYTIRATDSLNAFGLVTCGILACPPVNPPPVITCASPPTGLAGVAYSHAFPVSGGTPPFTFVITSGFLPPGLTLDPATGIVSGTATTPGTFPFTIEVISS